MKVVDTSVFVARSESRIKPETVDLGNLPPIQKPLKPYSSVPKENLVFQGLSPSSPPRTLSSQANQLQATKQPDNHATKESYIRFILAAKALEPLTLRFPQELWEEIDEVMYGIKRRFKRKLTKNELIVLAVGLLLRGFKEQDLDSDLYKLLVVKRG